MRGFTEIDVTTVTVCIPIARPSGIRPVPKVYFGEPARWSGLRGLLNRRCDLPRQKVYNSSRSNRALWPPCV